MSCGLLVSFLCLFFLLFRRPLSATLFPYTTLFRSRSLLRGPQSPVIYTLFTPAEGSAQSRFELQAANASIALDYWDGRSEEHTSELQSHSDLVCRLLLEKKNRQ